MTHLKGSPDGILRDDEQILTPYPEKEKRQSQILESLAAAVYTCNGNRYVTFCNKAAADLWGREPGIGKDLWCGSWKIYEPDGITPLIDFTFTRVRHKPNALNAKSGYRFDQINRNIYIFYFLDTFISIY